MAVVCSCTVCNASAKWIHAGSRDWETVVSYRRNLVWCQLNVVLLRGLVSFPKIWLKTHLTELDLWYNRLY